MRKRGGLNLSAGFDFLKDKHLITVQLFSIRLISCLCFVYFKMVVLGVGPSQASENQDKLCKKAFDWCYVPILGVKIDLVGFGRFSQHKGIASRAVASVHPLHSEIHLNTLKE